MIAFYLPILACSIIIICNILQRMASIEKAITFYKKCYQSYGDRKEWDGDVFPIKQTRQQAKQFDKEFRQFDQTEKQQWFDHNYFYVLEMVTAGQLIIKPRKIIIQLLHFVLHNELKLQQDYDFQEMINYCWIQAKKIPENVQKQLNSIYRQSGYETTQEKKRPRKQGMCGCAGQSNCVIC